MPNDKVIILVTKCTTHFVLAVAKELQDQMEVVTIPLSLYPNRFSYRSLKDLGELSDIFTVEPKSGMGASSIAYKNSVTHNLLGKDVVLLCTDHTTLTLAEDMSRILDLHNVKHRKYVLLLDIPMNYFSGREHYYSDFIGAWDTIRRILTRDKWDIIAAKTPTYYHSYFYLRQMPVAKVYYPVFFVEPTSAYKGVRDYAICCANMIPDKGHIGIIEAFKDLKDTLDLYFVGSGSEEDKCKGLAHKYGIRLRILSNISEQEKYNYINGAKFGVAGEKDAYCGSGSISECMWCGKTSVVWDNPLNREMYLDKHILFARTQEEFTAQMQKALTMETNAEEMREFVQTRYSLNAFVTSLRKILWPND